MSSMRPLSSLVPFVEGGCHDYYVGDDGDDDCDDDDEYALCFLCIFELS